MIELTLPADRAWHPVFRLVLGGVADRAGFGFEQLDNLQLAVERLLAEGSSGESVTLAIELADGLVRTRVGPLRAEPIEAVLGGPAPESGELTLRRVLETIVDDFTVEHSGASELAVVFELRVRGR